MPYLDLLISAFAGYLLGSVPFGLILTRFAGAGDIRAIGSGNIGATNVLRTGRKGLAAATLLLDALKGTAAVLIAAIYVGHEATLVAALAAVIGHLFPVWLKFKGGKGVATMLGAVMALAWPVGVLSCLTWIVVAALFRFSSLAALVAVSAAPFYTWYTDQTDTAIAVAVLAAMVVAKHHTNIRRLLNGTEPKIGKK